MPGPIRPDEVRELKTANIPEEVFETFNRLIAQKWDGNSAVIRQGDAVKAISNALQITREAIFNGGFLDVEESYRAAGWDVDYDKPGFNESYEATFTFSKDKKR